MSAVLSRFETALTTGRRPMNSGMSPNFMRSSGSTRRKHLVVAQLRVPVHLGAEADALAADAALDDLVDPGERAPADEEDVGRIDLDELLMGVLAATLRRNGGGCPFEDLEQRLLDSLA